MRTLLWLCLPTMTCITQARIFLSLLAMFMAMSVKAQTLFPGKTITNYDPLTLGIETDSYYSETGTDIYELGMVDGEIPAVRNRRDGNVITFRI